MPGTILFGIDVETPDENSAGFIRYGVPLFDELGVPVTWYVTGATLSAHPGAFREIEAHPLIDLQAHTYNHVIMKAIWMKIPEGKTIHGATDYFFQNCVTPAEVDADLARCQQAFRDILGRPALGLTGPWAYYRGLGDRPDLLDMVHRHGFRFLRTFGRNETDGQPVPLEWQPLAYTAQGRPDVLELLIHDYQDDFYWEAFNDPAPGETYADHMMRMVDRVAAEDLVWSTCSHDHGAAAEEGFAKKGEWYRAFMSYARDQGVRFLTGKEFYRERMGRMG